MFEINYVFRAKSPLFTGAGSSLGIKSELRKQKVKIANTSVIKSKFANEGDRMLAMVDIFTILYSHLDADYRLKRGSDIWKEFKSGLISCAGSKSKATFLSRFAQRFNVGHFNIELLKYFNLFDDIEFLQFLTDNCDYILMLMRFNRETKNTNFKKIKEIEKEIAKLLDILDKEKDSIFFDDTDTKKQIDDLWAEQQQLELQKTGLTFDVDNYQSEGDLFYQKDFENVPYFSGNSIAGLMRRLVMADFFRVLEIDSVFDFTYHTFFTGGSLTEKVDNEFVEKLSQFQSNIQEKLHKTIKNSSEIFGKNDEREIEKSEQLAFYCPPLRLFGAATKGGMIESEMIVSNARLKCKENGNGDVTLWNLIEDTFYTRKDSEKTERNIEVQETSNETTQMKYIMETLIEGSEFEHNIVLKSKNKYIENCFHATLRLFSEYHRIGGKSARGLGDIDMEQLINQINYDKVAEYYQHLEANKKEIRGFIGV